MWPDFTRTPRPTGLPSVHSRTSERGDVGTTRASTRPCSLKCGEASGARAPATDETEVKFPLQNLQNCKHSVLCAAPHFFAFFRPIRKESRAQTAVSGRRGARV